MSLSNLAEAVGKNIAVAIMKHAFLASLSWMIDAYEKFSLKIEEETMAERNSGFTIVEMIFSICIIVLMIQITGISRWNIWFSLEGALEKAQRKYPSATKIDVIERNLFAPSIIKLRDARKIVIATCNLESDMSQQYKFKCE